MHIKQISSVVSLKGLADHLISRSSSNALTPYSLMQIYRKFEELKPFIHPVPQHYGDSDSVLDEFVTLVEDIAKNKNIQSTPPFSEWLPSYFSLLSRKPEEYEGSGEELITENVIPSMEWAELHQPQLDQIWKERAELQHYELYLKKLLMAFGFLDPVDQERFIAENKKNVAGLIQNMAYINLEFLKIPLCHQLFESDLQTVDKILGDDSEEINILSAYIKRRDELLNQKTCPITKENKEIYLYDLRKLKDWSDLIDMNVAVNPGAHEITGSDSITDVMRLIETDRVQRISINPSLRGDVVFIDTYLKPKEWVL